jgi:hypothetical protein
MSTMRVVTYLLQERKDQLYYTFPSNRYSSRTLELSFNSKEFGREFLTKPSMFGKLEVHASEVVWRFEPITFYISSSRVKLILAPHALGSTLVG